MRLLHHILCLLLLSGLGLMAQITLSGGATLSGGVTINQNTALFYSDDFEGAADFCVDAQASGCSPETNGSFAVNTVRPHAGTKSFEQHYVIPNASCGGTQAQTRFCRKDITALNGGTDVYLQWWLYTAEPTGAGVRSQLRKMARLQDLTVDWEVVLVFDASAGDPYFGRVEVINAETGAVNFCNSPGLEHSYDVWTKWEVRVKVNSASMTEDGAIQVWKNGTQVCSDTTVNVRGADTNGVQYVQLGLQAQKSGTDSTDEKRYVDDIKMATSYIGP